MVEIIDDQYDGHSEAEGGYEQAAGVVCRIRGDDREYCFEIEAGSHHASSLPGLLHGQRWEIHVHAPWAPGSAVSGIPQSCPVFHHALQALKARGVVCVSFYNGRSGGFEQFALQDILDGAEGDARPSLRIRAAFQKTNGST